MEFSIVLVEQDWPMPVDEKAVLVLVVVKVVGWMLGPCVCV